MASRTIIPATKFSIGNDAGDIVSRRRLLTGEVQYFTLYYGADGVVITLFTVDENGHRSAEYIYHSQTLGM